MLINGLTLKEIYERLGKSIRTISRYISNGILNPTKEKSDRGTLEYRFEWKEVEKIKISSKINRIHKIGQIFKSKKDS